MITVKTDIRAKIISTIAVIFFTALIVWVYWRSSGSFLPAWFTILAIAILLLVLMSIPKGVKISAQGIEIHCLVEITCINFVDIKGFKILERRALNPCFPITGSFGFFGYYGFFYSFGMRRIFKIYSKSWKNLVLIENKDGKLYVISVPDPASFVKNISSFVK